MSATGLPVFDKTLQTTNIWLNEIGEMIGPDKQRCYHALRAVLFAMRDRLTTDEAFHVSAQLPMLVRGIYWDGYRRSGKPDQTRTQEQFVAKVAEHIGQIGPIDPEDCVKAVFRVLERHLPQGEMEEVRNMLPEPIRNYFPRPGQQSRVA